MLTPQQERLLVLRKADDREKAARGRTFHSRALSRYRFGKSLFDPQLDLENAAPQGCVITVGSKS